MRCLFSLTFLGALLGAAAPLQVTGVEQTGLPPFSAEGRRYRLEGDGFRQLRVGEQLDLLRASGRGTGRLEIVAVMEHWALGRLVQSGQTYPLAGDQAQRRVVTPLPRLPEAATTAPAQAKVLPVVSTPLVVPPPVSGPLAPRRDSLLFHRGDANLSPAGSDKLGAWVGEWGRGGSWRLEVPGGTESPLAQARVAALRARLAQAGVERVEVRAVPAGATERYDAIHVARLPW